MNKLKNKLENTKTSFSKNLVFNLIIPAVITVVALVFGIVFGFNKGIDFNGGLMVSIVADNNDLTISKEYNEFTKGVNEVLADNKLDGAVYLLEKDSVTYKDVLVVKIAYSGNEEQIESVVSSLKSGLVEKFYSETSETELELRNLVVVSTFGPSVDSWVIVSSILATLVTVLLICVYVGFRNGLDTAVLTVISSACSSLFAFALIMVSRIQINIPVVAMIPFVSIGSAILTYLFVRKSKKLSKSDEYTKKPNYVLADNVLKKSLYRTIMLSVICLIIALAFALVNICNPVLWFGLSIFVAIVALVYTNLFIIPAIFALTYVRRVKKEKAKKEKKSDKINEEDVLKETDLDNLVSN